MHFSTLGILQEAMKWPSQLDTWWGGWENTISLFLVKMYKDDNSEYSVTEKPNN